MWRVTVLFIFLVKFSNCLDEGDPCPMADGSQGICVQLDFCESAMKLLDEQEIFPTKCSFVGATDIEVVCCADSTTTSTTTTTTVGPSFNKYYSPCPPIPLNETEPKTGKKSRDKCVEYQEQLVKACAPGRTIRQNNCWNQMIKHIIDGENTFRGEFPHMALLGYESETTTINFRCGGTLLSEKFILTAAHCTSSVDGDVKYALIDAINKTDYTPDKLHIIKRVIKHPRYKSPSSYHDIALLELETPIELNPYIVPACLDVSGADQGDAIATGWGLTSYGGSLSDVLLKVTLEKFENSACVDAFSDKRNLKNGFDVSTQLCFGGKNSARDTCGGDSGGPLQIKDSKIQCMYTIVGITSIGNWCGLQEPAIYTKVAPYVDWIESIVWPE